MRSGEVIVCPLHTDECTFLNSWTYRRQCRIYNFLKLVTEAHKQESLPDFEITLCGGDCPQNSVHVFGLITCDDKFFFNIPIVQWYAILTLCCSRIVEGCEVCVVG